MNRPPDPGGGNLNVGAEVFITPLTSPKIDSSISSMDTDGSIIAESNKRKRISTHKRASCKNCHKRKKSIKANESYVPKDGDCVCEYTVNSKAQPSQSTPTSAPVPISTALASQNPYPNSVRAVYNPQDAAPYIVHVQREQAGPDDSSTLHPVTFGRFLKQHSIKNIVDGSLKKIGRNRLVVSFNKYQDANSFIEDKRLGVNKYKAFIPIFHITRMGIIRGVPVDLEPEDVIDSITVPLGCGKILKCRRINKKIFENGSPKWTPTQTIILTFEGQVLPKRVFMSYTALSVDLYIYPTIQCYNCCKFGHTKLQCRSATKCYKCSGDHSGEHCSPEEDNVRCFLCSGNHFANNKTCPEHVRQKAIKITMAQSSISYLEAIKLHPPVGKSYSEILSSTPPTQNHELIQQPSLAPHHSRNQFSSYKKTVFLKSKSPQKSYNLGFDQKAHQSLINDYDMPTSANGIALNNRPEATNVSTEDLIITLIKTLLQQQPSNESKLYNMLYTFIKNHGSNHSVESSQCKQ